MAVSARERVCYRPHAVPHVYTAQVRVRHHEVDAFGYATPATHLRILAQTAIDASSDAGFDAAWYAAAGGRWLVRRTTFTVHRPVRDGSTLQVRTWVEDFRRVLSARRYAVQAGPDVPVLDAVTDWVFVEAGSGRIRRIPEAFHAGFGVAAGSRPRVAFRLPPPPAEPGRGRWRVRWAELDALAHVNNAAWFDRCVDAVVDVLAARGWPVARLAAEGAVPGVAGGDVEYLGAAVHGDELETLTWFTPAAQGLDAHQRIVRVDDGRALVEATSAWRWTAAGELAAPPAALSEALRTLRAA